jgi:hypothetical protein
MSNSGECVEYIRNKMANKGMKGQQSSGKSAHNILTAENIGQIITKVEQQFSECPSYTLVEKVMNLYREAIEKFGAAGDNRFQNAIHRIHHFLQRHDVIQILDNKNKSNNKSNNNNNIKKHEVNTNYNTINNNSNSNTIYHIENDNSNIENNLAIAIQISAEEDKTIEELGNYIYIYYIYNKYDNYIIIIY